VCCRTCSDGHVYAYLHDGDAPDVANPDTGNNDDRLNPELNPSTSSAQPAALSDVDSQYSVTDTQDCDINIPTKKARTVKNSAAAKAKASDKSVNEIRHVAETSDNSSRWTLTSACSSASNSQVTSYSGSELTDSQSSSHVQTDIGKEDFLLRPGSFRVLLCVDNQEFYAKYVSVYYLRCCSCLVNFVCS